MKQQNFCRHVALPIVRPPNRSEPAIPERENRILLKYRCASITQEIDIFGNLGVTFPAGTIMLLDIKQGCTAEVRLWLPGGVADNLEITETIETP